MKYLAIVQARTNSSRLPNKVITKILKKTVIEILLYRLSNSQLIEKIVIATTRKREDIKLTNNYFQDHLQLHHL